MERARNVHDSSPRHRTTEAKTGSDTEVLCSVTVVTSNSIWTSKPNKQKIITIKKVSKTTVLNKQDTTVLTNLVLLKNKSSQKTAQYNKKLYLNLNLSPLYNSPYRAKTDHMALLSWMITQLMQCIPSLLVAVFSVRGSHYCFSGFSVLHHYTD